MKNVCIGIFCGILLVCSGAALYAQDFGFGFDEGGGGAALPSPVKVSGEIEAAFQGYVHDFESGEKANAASLGDIVSGSLRFGATGANVDAVIALNLSAAGIGELWGGGAGNHVYTPLILDEAYLRAYVGPVDIEAGLRKLTWGRADSLGPLDVTNPLDYSDLTGITDIMAIKIARPMLHVSWGMGDFSKLEAVVIPNFAGHRFAQDAENRWTPGQIKHFTGTAEAGIFSRAVERYGPMLSNPVFDQLYPQVQQQLVDHFKDASIAALGPNTGGLEYFQTGLRYTTTIGPADLGAQYFYGHYFRPGITIDGIDVFFDDLIGTIMGGNAAYTGNPALLSPRLNYTRYHQLGLDYAQVLAGFNVRAEFAVHLTGDLSGDDGAVKNPFIGWSLGFDRDLFLGINANIQCNETVRLLDDMVGSNPVLDSEAETGATATRLTMRLSKQFLRDNLECKTTAIWDIEDEGCYIIPAVAWTIMDVTAELSAGVFAGREAGELGQYWENSFVKLGLKYSF